MNKFKYIAEETIQKPTWQQNEIGRRFLIMSGQWRGMKVFVNYWYGYNGKFEIHLMSQDINASARTIYMSEDEYLKVALEAESESPPLLAALPQMVAQQRERMRTI